MRILVIGERYSANLGDPIICETVQYQILEAFPDAEIIFADISGRSGYIEGSETDDLLKQGKKSIFKIKLSLKLTKLGFDTELIRFKKARKKIEAYIGKICDAEYDLAIFAGGQLFKDTFVFPIANFIEYLSSNDTPIIFNACGVGNIASRKMVSILSRALSNPCVKSITTRDDVETINEKFLINASIKAVKTSDPALWTKEVYGVQRQESELVGLGVMFAHNTNYNDLIAFWIDVVEELNSKNIKWRFFCNGSVKDYELASHILSTMNYSDKEKEELLQPRPTRPIDLVKIIAGFNSIISFRLHSHIVAYSLDVPGVAIVWDEKLKYFYRSINLENKCKNIENDTEDIISELEKGKDMTYDDKLRERQKKESKDLLIYSIENYIS